MERVYSHLGISEAKIEIINPTKLLSKLMIDGKLLEQDIFRELKISTRYLRRIDLEQTNQFYYVRVASTVLDGQDATKHWLKWINLLGEKNLNWRSKSPITWLAKELFVVIKEEDVQLIVEELKRNDVSLPTRPKAGKEYIHNGLLESENGLQFQAKIYTTNRFPEGYFRLEMAPVGNPREILRATNIKDTLRLQYGFLVNVLKNTGIEAQLLPKQGMEGSLFSLKQTRQFNSSCREDILKTLENRGEVELSDLFDIGWSKRSVFLKLRNLEDEGLICRTDCKVKLLPKLL